MKWVCAVGILGLVICACGDKQNPGLLQSPASGTDPVSVTYADPIKALLDERCIGCHATTRAGSGRQGAPARINFDSYEDARQSAELANQRIQAGSMPPAGALAAADRQSFQAWVDQGLKE